MKKRNSIFSNITNNIWFGIKTSFCASKKYFSLKLLVLVSTTVIPLVNIWLWKEILNGIINVDINKGYVIACLAVYLLLKLCTYLLARFDEYINSRYSDELHFYIESVMRP